MITPSRSILNKILLILALFLLIFFISFLYLDNFVSVSILHNDSNFNFKENTNFEVDSNFDEYQKKMNEFEVNPEKIDKFVQENANEIID